MSAPGRLEVLGNHTDYNAGLTLSCAVALRCHAAIAPLDEPVVRLASTAFEQPPSSYPLGAAGAEPGHWTNYVLGVLAALTDRGHAVPGFELLVDSAVPRSAGVSSSAALEMAVLTALCKQMRLDLPKIELARIGQAAESRTVGAQTGLLDQLTSLCGERDRLLQTDFQTMTYRTLPLPVGWCFAAIDSGVKHDLKVEYNDRRAACEVAARAMGVATLREADTRMLQATRANMPEQAYHCAKHVIDENQRVHQASTALEAGDANTLGRLMFDSHESSRDHFRNSCPELDRLVDLARQDPRCRGARLSGGGFGGITIHLLEKAHAQSYLKSTLDRINHATGSKPWFAICTIDDGAG